MDGSWGKKSAMALQNFLKNEEERESPPLYKGKEDGDLGAATILALQKFLTQRGCNPGPLDSGLGDSFAKISGFAARRFGVEASQEEEKGCLKERRKRRKLQQRQKTSTQGREEGEF